MRESKPDPASEFTQFLTTWDPNRVQWTLEHPYPAHPGSYSVLKDPYKSLTATDDRVFVTISTTGYPTAGTVKIGDEEITYTSVDREKVLVVAQRGANGTAATPHAIPNDVSLRTTLPSAVTAEQTTIQIASTSGAPPTGSFTIGSAEIVTYTGKTSTTFTGCTRGANGTAASAWPAWTAVFYEFATLGCKPSWMIWEAAVQYSIHPKVILSMIAREHSMLMRPWDPEEYTWEEMLGFMRNAMGSGEQTDLDASINNGTSRLRTFYEEDQIIQEGVPYIFGYIRYGHVMRYHFSDDHVYNVKLKANNKATYSLFRYNAYTRTSLNGGGNLGFFQKWRDLGF